MRFRSASIEPFYSKKENAMDANPAGVMEVIDRLERRMLEIDGAHDEMSAAILAAITSVHSQPNRVVAKWHKLAQFHSKLGKKIHEFMYEVNEIKVQAKTRRAEDK